MTYSFKIVELVLTCCDFSADFRGRLGLLRTISCSHLIRGLLNLVMSTLHRSLSCSNTRDQSIGSITAAGLYAQRKSTGELKLKMKKRKSDRKPCLNRKDELQNEGAFPSGERAGAVEDARANVRAWNRELPWLTTA